MDLFFDLDWMNLFVVLIAFKENAETMSPFPWIVLKPHQTTVQEIISIK